jgi:hypothetical protein
MSADAKVFRARHALGHAVRGIALVAHDGFSARYDLDRIAGVFSRPAHKLAGQSYVGRILVLDTAKGGVATAWMLHEMQSRRMAPLAIVFNSVNPILVRRRAGRRHAGGFTTSPPRPNGAELEIDPETGTVKVLTA